MTRATARGHLSFRPGDSWWRQWLCCSITDKHKRRLRSPLELYLMEQKGESWAVKIHFSDVYLALREIPIKLEMSERSENTSLEMGDGEMEHLRVI